MSEWKLFKDEKPDPKRWVWVYFEGYGVRCEKVSEVPDWKLVKDTHWQYADVPDPPKIPSKKPHHCEVQDFWCHEEELGSLRLQCKHHKSFTYLKFCPFCGYSPSCTEKKDNSINHHPYDAFTSGDAIGYTSNDL